MKPKFHYTSIKANLHLLALMNKYITKLNSFIFWNTFPKHAIGENEKINAFSIWAQCWFTTWNADFYCVLSTFNESSCTQETSQQKRIINLGLHSSAPFLKRYWWKWGLRNIYDLMHIILVRTYVIGSGIFQMVWFIYLSKTHSVMEETQTL